MGGRSPGQAITYDAIGNPINYRGRQHYWSGRDLNTVVVGSASAVQFAYNAAGQRISKSYANNTTKFYYDDSGNLIGMRQNYDQPIKFQVNYATGEIDGFTQGTNTYWYRKNQQGDVTGIFNTAYGNTALFVEYEYDAWGNVISITGDGASTIGQTNPIRYRGYFYDTETGYYYLNSRYYDPTTGRFLNCDVYASTGQGVLGCNAFAYCLNNPITFGDPNGTNAIILFKEKRPEEKADVAHLGIMVQDEDGQWYHYFWGSPNKNFFIKSIFSPITAYTVVTEYNGATTLEAINNSGVYWYEYSDMVYLYGDFSGAVDDLKEGGEYSAVFNNCAQRSLGILAEQDTIYQETLQNAATEVFPETAFQSIVDELYPLSIPEKVTGSARNTPLREAMLK